MIVLTELIDRLERATAPDREFDIEIGKLFPKPAWATEGTWFDKDDFTKFPSVTSSVDEAIALAERVLPGWRVENLCEWDAEILRDQGPWMCDLVERGLEFFDRKASKCSHAATPALALCIAVLKAIQSQEPNP